MAEKKNSKKESKLSKLKMPVSGDLDGMELDAGEPSSEDDGSGHDDYGDYADHDESDAGDQNSEGADGKDGEADMGNSDLEKASDDDLMSEIRKRGLMSKLEESPHDEPADEAGELPAALRGGSSRGRM